MPSTLLLEIAAALDFSLHSDQETVFGKVDGYRFTAVERAKTIGFFTSVAGITPEHLQDLSAWLEKTAFSLKLETYDLDANFLGVFAHKPLFSGVKKAVSFLHAMTTKLSDLAVPVNACAVCGEEAATNAMYMGLFAAIHEACVDREGHDFTGQTTMSNEADDFIKLEEDSVQEKSPLATIAASMKDYEQAFVDDTVALCAIKSVKGTPSEEAPYGQETRQALDWFLKRGEALGFKAVNVDNRAGYLEMGEGEEMVACVCHLDVVPAGDGWTYDPFVARVEDGKIIARGTSDDKGPALMGVYALKALLDDPDFKAKKRLRIIVGLDEESGSTCMDHYVKTEEIPVAGFTADAEFPAIYAEKGITRIELSMPRTGNEPLKYARGGEALNMVAAKASFSLKMRDGHIEELTYAGKPAHASTPELGENAIVKGFKDVKHKLDEGGLKDEFVDAVYHFVGDDLNGANLGIDFEDESGRTSMNVGTLSIGEKEARIGIDVRYPVTLDINAAFAEKKAELEACGVQVNTVHGMDPLNLGKTSDLIQTLMSTYNEMMEESDEAVAIGGGTYARSVPNIAAFGPAFPDDEHVAHQADEYISIEKAMAAAAIYREVFRKLGS